MLSLKQMRKLVRQGLGGLDEGDMPDPDVDLLLNMSLWEIDSKYPFKEKEARLEFNTVAGQGTYSLSSIMSANDLDLDALQSVAVMQDGKSKKLQRMMEDWFDIQYDESADVQAIPEHYLRRNMTLQLWPVPDDVYTVRLFILKNVEALAHGSVESTGLPRNWDELVVEGAITRGQYYRQDYNLAQQSENFRVGKVRSASSTEAKEEEDSRWAGLVVQHDEPGSL